MCNHYAKHIPTPDTQYLLSKYLLAYCVEKKHQIDLNNGEIKNFFYFFQQILTELLLCMPGTGPGTGEVQGW